MATEFDKRAFGRRLAAIRTEKGLSQEGLAAKSGVSLNSIARYESADVAPGADNILKLADALECSSDVLLLRCDITTREP